MAAYSKDDVEKVKQSMCDDGEPHMAAQVNGDNALDMHVAHHKKMMEKLRPRMAFSRTEEEFKAVSDKLAGLEADKAKTDQQVLTLSRQINPNPPDPEIMADRAENYDEKIDILCARGLPVAKGDELKKLVRNANGHPQAFMLSRAPEIDKRPLDLILSFVGGLVEDGLVLGPKAGAQARFVQPRLPAGSETTQRQQISMEELNKAREIYGLPPEKVGV